MCRHFLFELTTLRSSFSAFWEFLETRPNRNLKHAPGKKQTRANNEKLENSGM